MSASSMPYLGGHDSKPWSCCVCMPGTGALSPPELMVLLTSLHWVPGWH